MALVSGKQVFYHRKEIAATAITEFFDVAVAKAANKELDTNMPDEKKFLPEHTFVLERIVAIATADEPESDLRAVASNAIVEIRHKDDFVARIPLVNILVTSSARVTSVVDTTGTATSEQVGVGNIAGVEILPLTIGGGETFYVRVNNGSASAIKVYLCLIGTLTVA